MPSLSNDGLDDQLLLDGNDSFVGGQVSSTRANLVSKDAYVEGKNIDLDEFGNAITRRGASLTVGYLVWEDMTADPDDRWEEVEALWEGLTAPITGMNYFDVDTSERLVIADGTNTLKTCTEDGAFTLISGSTVAAGADVNFAQLVNRLYYADGDSALRYVDSSYANQAISAGRITSIEVTDGGLGYTSVPTVAVVSSAGSGATATAVLGYGGKLVGIDVDTEGSGYEGTVQPTVTITVAPTDGTDATAVAHSSQAPTKPKLLITHSNRLFCTSGDTSIPSDQIFVSDILDGESWDLIGNSIRVGGGDGDPIVAMQPWFDFSLLIFKERSIWMVNADPAQAVGDWEIKLVNGRTGCVASRSVQQVGADVLFLARDGIRSIKTIEAGAQTDVSQPISTPINDLIGRINQANIGKCTAVYWHNRYLIAVPLDSSTTQDYVFCYHLLAKAWTGYWTGWQPRDWAISAFGGKLRLNIGDQTGKLFTWDDFTAEDSTTAETYTDGGTVYESFIKSRAYRFGETWGDKIGYSAQFNLENIHTTTISSNLSYYADLSSAAQTLASSVTLPASTNLIRKGYNMVSKGRFNQIQFKVQAASGRLALHSIQASAFGQPIKAEA